MASGYQTVLKGADERTGLAEDAQRQWAKARGRTVRPARRMAGQRRRGRLPEAALYGPGLPILRPWLPPARRSPWPGSKASGRSTGWWGRRRDDHWIGREDLCRSPRSPAAQRGDEPLRATAAPALISGFCPAARPSPGSRSSVSETFWSNFLGPLARGEPDHDLDRARRLFQPEAGGNRGAASDVEGDRSGRCAGSRPRKNRWSSTELATRRLHTHADCLDHDTGQGHPERIQRLGAVLGCWKAPAFDALWSGARRRGGLGADCADARPSFVPGCAGRHTRAGLVSLGRRYHRLSLAPAARPSRAAGRT